MELVLSNGYIAEVSAGPLRPILISVTELTDNRARILNPISILEKIDGVLVKILPAVIVPHDSLRGNVAKIIKRREGSSGSFFYAVT